MGLKFDPFENRIKQVGVTEQELAAELQQQRGEIETSLGQELQAAVQQQRGEIETSLGQELQAAVQRVEGTASVATIASASLAAGSTGPVAVSLADTEFLGTDTSIKGLLGTVYGVLSRAADGSYSFTSEQVYTGAVTLSSGTTFAAAHLPNTLNPLRVGQAELQEDLGYAHTGYAYTMLDASGRIAWGVKTDGSIVINKVGSLAGAFFGAFTGDLTGDVDADEIRVNKLMRVGQAELQEDPNYIGSGYAYTMLDASGRIAWGVKTDGSIVINKLDSVTGAFFGAFTGNLTGDVDADEIRVNKLMRVGQAELQEDLDSADTGYAYTMIDAAGRIAWGVKTDGSIVINKLDSVTGAFFGAFTGNLTGDVDADEIRVNKLIAPNGTIDLDSADTQLLNILEGGAQTGDAAYQELYAYTMIDAAGRIAWGVRPDGTAQFSKQIEGEAARAAQLTPLGDNEIEEDAAYDFYAHVEVDSENRISRAILPSGKNYFPSADFDKLTIKGKPLGVSGDSSTGIEYDDATGAISSVDGQLNRVIVKWGDSISNDIDPATVLEQLTPGRQMITRSVGGSANGSILARFGALPITGRVYWEVKTVTVASYSGDTVTLSAGDTTDIEVGDFFNGAGQHNDTVVTAVNLNTDEITLSIDAGALVTASGAYTIQRPKIEAGQQTKIDDLLPKTVTFATTYELFSHFYIKNLKGVPYPGSTQLPRNFNRLNDDTSSDWADVIAEYTADGYISTAPDVIVDTTVTSGGTAAGATSIIVADAERIAPGHFIMAQGIPYGCRVWGVDYETNTVKLAMETDSAITGNVRVYTRVDFGPETTTEISGIGEVNLKYCTNIFDFDDGRLTEEARPYWWPNQYHGPERFDFGRADQLAQYRAFVNTQKSPYGKYLITSYQIWGGIYEGDSNWNRRRSYALLAAESFPENFYDLARDVWVKAESWYQSNYLTMYQANWEKTFIEMGFAPIAEAPTSGSYSNGDPLMDGDLWIDDATDTDYVLLLTTGDATHDAAQEEMFGSVHTLPTTAGEGIWIPSMSYRTLAGTVSLRPGLASGRSGVVDGVTYQGSAYDIIRKSSPRIGKRDGAHSNPYGKKLLGYLIGQELLRRGW